MDLLCFWVECFASLTMFVLVLGYFGYIVWLYLQVIKQLWVILVLWSVEPNCCPSVSLTIETDNYHWLNGPYWCDGPFKSLLTSMTPGWSVFNGKKCRLANSLVGQTTGQVRLCSPYFIHLFYFSAIFFYTHFCL